jgi:hypothetical protein
MQMVMGIVLVVISGVHGRIYLVGIDTVGDFSIYV